ncbi:MAG TPA: response regulator, partial [Myxococcaceae bacterium]|nr:response regulator [Myxococcaceae bacterium]
LRAPLQVLLGHGQLLLESLEPGAETQQRLSAAAILRQGKKILNLVESLLDRGRGEATRISLDGRTLDISEVCKEAAQELAILAAERGIALRAETPESLTVYGDEIKLRQVLQNLITHGIARSPNNGSLTVRAQRLARPDGDVAKVFVEDIGPALSPEELPMAFDRYGADPSGPGLGLAICRQLAELHGGEVYAENRREGGAAFTVLLPLAQALPKTTPRAVKHPQVLLVEDEPEVVALVVAALRSRYRVTVAADGAQGLAQARALRPDAIVMDVFLPRTDGLEAAVALKSAPDTAGIPVILLSADQRVADKVRALGLEGVDTVAKPVQASELIDRVERVLRLRETQLELERSQSLLRRAGGDPETGLLDRGGLLQRLEEEVARAQRYGRPWVLALLTAQRPLGEGLRTCATALRDKLRPPDAVAHLGGGTFVLVLPELPPDAGRAAMYRLGAELRAETGFGFDFRLTRVAESASGGAALAQLLEESGD